jgi:hypothetical protein
MTRKLTTIGAAIGTALMLAVSSAWSASNPSRDAGDASGARLGRTKLSQVIRDAGDATSAKLVFSTRNAPPGHGRSRRRRRHRGKEPLPPQRPAQAVDGVDRP